MAGGNIDWTDWGWYKAGSVMPHPSRLHAAFFESFRVEEVEGCFWEVRRVGGGTYLVEAYGVGGDLYMYCDCHDFNAYGFGFSRACMHIWRVKLTRDVGVC